MSPVLLVASMHSVMRNDEWHLDEFVVVLAAIACGEYTPGTCGWIMLILLATERKNKDDDDFVPTYPEGMDGLSL